MDLTDKDFIITIINILKELKKTMLEEVDKGMTTLQQIENVNKEREVIFKKNYVNIVEVKKYNN